VVPVLGVVAAETRRRFPDVARLVLWHRTGALQVTEAAVVVAVSSAHRDAAFDAARWAIDEVKATAPIWKREHWAGGHDDWGRCDHRHDHDVAGLHRAQAVAP
jgi:molybdopterin synthase catalytic subunit